MTAAARPARAPVMRPPSVAALERITRLEERQEAADRRASDQGNKLQAIEEKVQKLLDIVQRVTGMKMLLIATGTFIGITAGTVTATVGAIRLFTGH